MRQVEDGVETVPPGPLGHSQKELFPMTDARPHVEQSRPVRLEDRRSEPAGAVSTTDLAAVVDALTGEGPDDNVDF